MKKALPKSFLLSVILILLLAVVLRFYKLGTVPHGMTWDEAAIGYNGYAIFHTRRDEWLSKLPVSFKSFGDFKSPFAIYLNGPFTFLLGMNLFAVRFPFALAGVLTVLGCLILGYILAKQSLPEKQAKTFGLGIGLLAAISPWAIHFSRVGFESGLALCLVVWGVVAVMSFLLSSEPGSSRAKHIQISQLLIGIILLVTSFYTYHSAKIVVPLLVLSLLVLYWPHVKAKLRVLLPASFFGLLLLLPLLRDTFLGNGGNRFAQATIFGQSLPLPKLISEFFSHFLLHFSPTFLIMGQTVTLRHGDGHWGVLFVTDFILVILGIIFLFVKKASATSGKKEMWLGVAWVLIGLLPAAIGTDVPHSNRGLLALPGFLILAGFGFYHLLKYLSQTSLNRKVSGSKGETHLLVKSVAGMFILFHMFFAISYLHDYYTNFAKKSANDFQDGFIEAFQFAVQNEATSDQILISDKYGQAYIFALFVRKTNPIWYQGGIMVKYVYLPKISEADLDRKNTVIIATPDQIEPKFADQLVYGSDGEIKFVLVKTK